MAKKARKPRKRFMFWLNFDSPFADYIAELKYYGMFTSSVRDGLRLLKDLREGKTDVLEELFPGVLPKPEIVIDETTTRRIVQDEILKNGFYRDQPTYEQSGAIAPNSGNLEQLPPPEELDADDDLLKIKTSEGDGGRSNMNFLASMNALCGLGLDLDKLEKTASVGAIKKMAGADQPLPIPVFDDLEL